MLRIEVGTFKADLFQQLLHDRLQATRADIFSLLIDLRRVVRDGVDGVGSKLHRHAFGFHHRLVLLDQRIARLGQNSFEVFDSERLELNTDRKTSLQLGNQVRRLRNVKSTGRYEKYVIGAHHAVASIDGRTFDDRQNVALHTL